MSDCPECKKWGWDQATICSLCGGTDCAEQQETPRKMIVDLYDPQPATEQARALSAEDAALLADINDWFLGYNVPRAAELLERCHRRLTAGPDDPSPPPLA